MRNQGAVALAVAFPALPATPHTFPDTPRSPYAAGPLRRATDAALALVQSFLTVHPEYAVLGHDALLVAAETYLDADDAQALADLCAAGVPDDWSPAEDEADLRLAEELV